MDITKPRTSTKTAWRATLTRSLRASDLLIVAAALLIALGIYAYSGPSWLEKPTLKAYNLGVLAYREPPGLLPATQDRPSEWPVERARAYFEIAAAEGADTKLRALALYNLGTIIAREGYATSLTLGLTETPRVDITESIIRLSEAVRLDPDNEDAKYNLEVMDQVRESTGEKEGAPGPGYSPGSIDKGF